MQALSLTCRSLSMSILYGLASLPFFTLIPGWVFCYCSSSPVQFLVDHCADDITQPNVTAAQKLCAAKE